jgi:hypothetical protein
MDKKEVTNSSHCSWPSLTFRYNYDERTDEQIVEDAILGYLKRIKSLEEVVLDHKTHIRQLEARIKALEERPPTYVPYPVAPPTYPLGPIWCHANDTNTTNKLRKH